ncbi:MAG TPA: glutaminase A [Brevibacterium senegalense]|uniref:Glutaminase n=1 Tax=Brevibacterium senegalense TaxID=1033736 RepID=A0A921SNT6_9MICO|nr:glutaminase A [Brevibacterium senegalense]
MRSPVHSYLLSLHETVYGTDPFAASRLSRHRTVAAAEPEAHAKVLYGADPTQLGIAMTMADGHTYQVGDADVEFSIQSISKVFVYALALMDSGFDAVDSKIDVEPSGSAYNDISSESGSGRPKNPLINIGAIASVSLVRPDEGQTVFDRVLETMSACAGRELSLDQDVYEQELAGGAHNRGLAWFLSSWGIIDGDPVDAFDDYSRQCAVSVTAADLSVMASTLANLGVNPVTGQRVFTEDVVERVLSVMTTCGMYDDSGDWVTTVGLPAKSGVGGGIISVLPGQLGIATFSPPLDEHGNSASGIIVHEEMSADLGLHFVRAASVGRSSVRGHGTIDVIHSTVRRPAEADLVLAEHGDHAHVVELVGDIQFAGFEAVSRLIGELDDPLCVVLDLTKVDNLSLSTIDSLYRLAAAMDDAGIDLSIVDPDHLLEEHLEDLGIESFRLRYAALAWAENLVLRHFGDESCFYSPEYANAPMLDELRAEDRRIVVDLLVQQRYREGETVRAIGDPFDGIRFMRSGEVRTYSADGSLLAVLRAGTTFGEFALNPDGGQPFDMIVTRDTTLDFLPAEDIDRLMVDHPSTAAALWRSITVNGYTRLAQAVRGEAQFH